MWISDLSIRRPVFATMGIVVFMVLGIVSMTRLGIDLWPDVSVPFVIVTTPYPGAAPAEVESQVSRPVEDAVAGINGVKRVESHSTESLSRVIVEFHMKTDAQAAAADVREKVAAARFRLPKEVENPAVVRFDVAALPIMTFAVGSSLPPDVTRQRVEDDLKPLIEQIEGVASVEVNGGQVREIQVELDPRRMEALSLPLTGVAEVLASENLDVPAGQVHRDGQEVSLRTKGEFTRVDELGDVILRSAKGSTVRVRDVATVRDGFADRATTTRLNGVDAVSFSIRKQSGGNTAAISARVQAAIERARSLFPEFQITTVHDDAEYVLDNVSDVRFNIIFGGVMAVLIIFVFMRDWRSTVISGLALPTSVISTFFFMWLTGFTINMMSLMGLSLVIGILIDDAVVVRENIYRHMEHGEDAVTAARRGTAEIGLAVMATTFTILAVFLPVAFMQGIVGQFFKEFALTVAFAVAMSLFVAFSLDPMLSSRFVRYIPPEERMRTRAGRVLEAWGRAYDRVDRSYHRLLGIAIRHPYKVLAIATVAFFASLSTLAFVPMEFMPQEDRGQFDVLLDLPPGTSFPASEQVVADVERRILAVPEIRQVFTTIGLEGEVRRSVLRVRAVGKRERARGVQQIKAALRADLARIPFADIRVANPPFIQGAPNEAPIQVFIRGNDLPTLQRLSDELVRRARAIPGAVDISTTLVGGHPEMLARVDRALASDMGFSVGAVALQLRGMVEGVVPTKFRDGQKQYDVRVRLAPEFRDDFAALSRAPIYSPSGSAVRVGDIVKLEPGTGPSRIQREQRRRQARIEVDLDGRALSEVTGDVREAIDQMQIPKDVEVGFQGDVEMMQETVSGIVLALILAVAFIYIVLASQFESFLEPFLIMLSLPLALVGAILMLFITRQHLGMPAMIGMVMLMGLVTKNAILLVDHTNQRRREGVPLEEAILTAGPVRLRPILMTTSAMILGMMPAALGVGQGGEFRAPMALATIGGLITSTLLTLVLVPVSYLLLARITDRVKAGRKKPSPAATAAMRVTGMLLLLLLLGAAFAVSRAFAQSSVASPRGAGDPLVLTIDSAIKLAADQSELYQVARERVEEASARSDEARAAFLPTADVSYLYTPIVRFPLIRIPAGIFGPNELTFQAAFTRQNILRLDVTQPLYTGGRLRTGAEVRRTQVDESRLQLERQRQTLTLQVTQAFYAALLADQGVRVAEEGMSLAESHLSLARVRFDAGTAARLDVLRGEVGVANMRARLIQARSSREIAYRTLKTVLSTRADTPLRLEGTLDAEQATTAKADLVAALPSRPDLAAGRLQQQMAEGAHRLATAELKPTFALSGNWQYQEDAWGKMFRPDNRSYQVGFVVQVPLMAGPAASAKRGVAQAQIRQAEHGLKALTEGAGLELDSAWSELEAARQIVETAGKAVELAREGLSIAEVSYENGVITSVELSDARLSLLESQWSLAQARFGVIVASARTKHAAGTL